MPRALLSRAQQAQAPQMPKARVVLPSLIPPLF
jgi:hypothetical protein